MCEREREERRESEEREKREKREKQRETKYPQLNRLFGVALDMKSGSPASCSCVKKVHSVESENSRELQFRIEIKFFVSSKRKYCQ